MGKHEAAKLNTKAINDWLVSLANSPALVRTAKGAEQQYRETADTDEARRRRKSSANRVLTILKAALNVAYREGKVPADDAWRRVKPFARADAPKLRYLSDDEARRLVNACDGAALLDDIRDFYCRFVAFPSPMAAVACTLWAAHAHAMDAWESTPRLAFVSPEPGSGKSRALEITELLVPRPVAAVNVTPTYLFRKVADPDGRPTILHDEIDTVFGAKVRRDVEETRGLLNAGHRKGAVTGRCKMVGKTVETEEIEAYCAVALAGLGDLPDTVASRAVIVRMRRRAPSEKVEAFRRLYHSGEGKCLSDRLAKWMEANEAKFLKAWPAMPEGVEDRAADVWEPLLAVADLAGGTRSEPARKAAVSFVTECRETAVTLGVRLLSDIRTAFRDAEQVATADLLDRLNRMDEAP